MFNHVLILFFLLSSTAFSGEWRLEVLNESTRKVETFLPLNSAFTIPSKLSGNTCILMPKEKELTGREFYCLNEIGGFSILAGANRDSTVLIYNKVNNIRTPKYRVTISHKN